MTRDKIAEWMSEYNEEALLADGLEDAFMGMCEVAGHPPIALYDSDKCIDVLMHRDGMDYEGALECFQFNTVGAWVGENSPRYVTFYNGEE
jgi:hypothetical protein